MKKLNVRMLFVTPLVAAVLLSTGGCSSTPEVNLAAEEKAIRATETEFAKAAAAKDVDKVVAFYAEDAVMLPPGEAAATSKAAIQASWAQLLALPDLEMTWTPTKIEVAKSGDLAYDYGTFAMSHKNAAGKVVNDRGKYTTVWKKAATGGWKALVDTSNSDLPAPSAAAVKKASPKKTAPKAKKAKR
jgi:ketosteroid isomerase-like protein